MARTDAPLAGSGPTLLAELEATRAKITAVNEELHTVARRPVTVDEAIARAHSRVDALARDWQPRLSRFFLPVAAGGREPGQELVVIPDAAADDGVSRAEFAGFIAKMFGPRLKEVFSAE